jgi:hypothetical protein
MRPHGAFSHRVAKPPRNRILATSATTGRHVAKCLFFVKTVRNALQPVTTRNFIPIKFMRNFFNV